MTKLNPIPDSAVLVGIDVAKVRNEVLIELSGPQRRRRLTVLNTREEHDRLVALLSAYVRPVICAFEATGNYHRPLAWRLAEAGFEPRLISLMTLARTREALHNGWDKNDPRDAQVILHMLRIGASQLFHDPLAAGINDVQELSKAVMKALGLVPEDIPESAKAKNTFKRTLSNLAQITQGLGELQKHHRTGHGRPASHKGLLARHARCGQRFGILCRVPCRHLP